MAGPSYFKPAPRGARSPSVSPSLLEALRGPPARAATLAGPTAGLSPKSAAITDFSRGQLDIGGLLATLKALQAPPARMTAANGGAPAGGLLGGSGPQGRAGPMPHGDAAGLIVRYARQLGVDPRAALAVASVEGGTSFGAVGDQGTSYGPFQLHVGGALPRGKTAAWANSPAGLLYALRQIAGVSRGLTGRAAIEAIVRRFERPAAPGPEIQRALSHY